MRQNGGRSIAEQIAMQAAFAPAKAAVVMADRIYTYKMLADGISAVSRAVHDHSFDRNRPVGILVDNPGRHIIVLLALLSRGYAFCSLRKDLLGVAVASGVDQVVTDEPLPFVGGLKLARLDDAWFGAKSRAALDPVEDVEGQIVQIRFSSGSTGTPKAFGRTLPVFHKRIALKYVTGEAARPRFLTTVGLSGSALTYVMRVLMDGNTIYFAPQELALGSIFAWRIEEARVSAGQARTLLAQRETLGYDVRIGLLSCGAATLSRQLEADLRQAFGCEIINTYASTEGGVMALAAGDVLRLRERKGNCFVPLAEFQIVDDDGRVLPAGQEGRIRVRHDMASRVFRGNLFEHESVAPDGWLTTGDLGVIDADGLIVVNGRADEVINIGGVKFNPELIEDVLKRNPALASSAVVRVQLPSGEHQAWIACASAQAPALDLVNQWISRNAAGELSAVRFAKIAAVERIPVTAAGKIARAELRRMLLAGS